MAGPEDAEALASLATLLGYPTNSADVRTRLGSLAREEGHAVFVAHEGGGRVVGWIHLMPQQLLYLPTRAEIGGLFVHGDYRRRGVGRMLVDVVEEWAKGRGYLEVVVRSNVARIESHSFYPGVGYRVEKTKKVCVKGLADEPGPGGR